MREPKQQPKLVELTLRVTEWVGSPMSLVLHTIVFLGFFVAVLVGALRLETMLLILTTIVSLEAIYLAILIQMTVNMNTVSLREVEEDIDEIQEDVEELGEDMDEIQEDIEEISEDLEELNEEDEQEEQRDTAQAKSIDELAAHVRHILEDLEALKRKR